MNVRITSGRLCGKVKIPPSKSVAHRLIICAALSEGRSVVKNVYPSKDITATMDAMRALGAKIDFSEGTAVIDGIEKAPESCVIDCCESGSTLRFLIPVAAALGVKAEFHGRAKLPERPITPYLEEFPKHGVTFEYNYTMPFSISGRLTAGEYRISGGISSQFITGLLLALSTLSGDSEIVLTSHLESKPYVDITVGCLEKFGCKITETEDGYYIKGGQKLTHCDCEVEGDFSQAAFFEVADSLGSEVEIIGLDENSSQGDKKIIEICREMVYNKNGPLKPFSIDCSDIPDLVPVLTVLASFCEGRSEIYNVARLKIKECDRLEAISSCLNRLGGKVKAYEDRLVIDGVSELSGGEVETFEDHRIAMSMAVASAKCSAPLVIKGAECVSKSYPNFWEDFKALGGKFEVI